MDTGGRNRGRGMGDQGLEKSRNDLGGQIVGEMGAYQGRWEGMEFAEVGDFWIVRYPNGIQGSVPPVCSIFFFLLSMHIYSI